MTDKQILNVLKKESERTGMPVADIIDNWMPEDYSNEDFPDENSLKASLYSQARANISDLPADKQLELMKKFGIGRDPSSVKINRDAVLKAYDVDGLGKLNDSQIAHLALHIGVSVEDAKSLLNKASEEYIASNAKQTRKIHEADLPVIREYMSRRVNGGDLDEMRELFAKRPDLIAEFDAIEDGTSVFAKAASFVNRYAGGGSSANAYAEHVVNPDEYEGDYDGMARPIAADGVTGAVDLLAGKGVGKAATTAISKAAEKTGIEAVKRAANRPVVKSAVANAGDAVAQGAGEVARQAVAGEDVDVTKAGVVAGSQATVPYALEMLASKAASFGKVPVLTPMMNKARRGSVMNPEVMAKDAMYVEGYEVKDALSNAERNSSYIKNKMDEYGMQDSKAAINDAENKYLSAAQEKAEIGSELYKVEQAHTDVTKKANRARNPERKAEFKAQQNELAKEIIELEQKYNNLNTDVLFREMEDAQMRGYARLEKKADEMIELANTDTKKIYDKHAEETLLTPQEQSLYEVVKGDFKPNTRKSALSPIKELVDTDELDNLEKLQEATKKSKKMKKVENAYKFVQDNAADAIGTMSNNASREAYNNGDMDFMGLENEKHNERKKKIEEYAKEQERVPIEKAAEKKKLEDKYKKWDQGFASLEEMQSDEYNQYKLHKIRPKD